MAVEARVSVQAMKGRFEQLHDDGPLPATPSPAPRTSTSPSRLRSTSPLRLRSTSVTTTNPMRTTPITTTTDTPIRLRSTSVTTKTTIGAERFHDKEDQETPNGFSHKGKSGKGSDTNGSPKNRSFLAGMSKAFRTKDHKKNSDVDTKNMKGTTEVSQHETSGNNGSTAATPAVSRVSEGTRFGTRPSVVRRIPVFKSSERLDGGKDKDLEDRGRNKTGTHTRSQSHGSFIIMRDRSAERNIHVEANLDNELKNKENVRNKGFFNMRQKSSDNLFNNRDSRTDFTFEGKQKLVATVVKNMKNKEKPKVLRKLSFTSKNEKDMKNKKEKDILPQKNERLQVLPASSPDKKPKWRDCSYTPDKTVEGKKEIDKKETDSISSTCLKTPSAESLVSTAAIAKAVADIAAFKTEVRSSEVRQSPTESDEADEVYSGPDSEDPPARPPRRRSTYTGVIPKKKGKAPSPPGPLAVNQDTPEMEASPSQLLHDNQKPTYIHDTRMLAEIQITDNAFSKDSKEMQWLHKDKQRSSDSLTSNKMSDDSRRSSPLTASDECSPTWSKKVSLPGPLSSRSSSPATQQEVSPGAQKVTSVSKHSSVFKYESVMYSEPNSEPDKEELDGLPAGPPPRKPPRTFAYDIYRVTKAGKTSGEESVEEKSPSADGPSPPAAPVYAVPVKKKKSDKILNIKPAVRSNSDLSKKELVKPLIAPKPPHIKTKVKRASLVDPLSCGEKDEDTAMTSEFQRQAHIRFSLRRPKKPPPAPPHCPDINVTSPDNIAEKKIEVSRESNLNCSRTSIESQERQHSLLEVRSHTSSPLEMSYDFGHDREISPTPKSHSSGQSLHSIDSDITPRSSSRQTSRSTYNLRVTSPGIDDDQPTSLTNFHTTSDIMMTGVFRKRSMSDETLYKGVRHNEEPIYATPVFPNKGSASSSRHRELHYMCSVLFSDVEEVEGGRDGSKGRRSSRTGPDPVEGNKGRSGIISLWKREFRQSCRQVQNKIKKSVIR